MIYEIQYTDEADKTIAKYKKSNPIAYKKVVQLIDEIIEHPRTGTGHPEPLVNGNDIRYSRRIKGKDRLIYDIFNNIISVTIISAEGHYNDK